MQIGLRQVSSETIGQFGRACNAGALTGGLAGFHPSRRQPLPGTQKLWEGIRFLSNSVIAIRVMQEWNRNAEREKKRESSVLG